MSNTSEKNVGPVAIPSAQLRNAALNVGLTERGALVRIENALADESYQIESDWFTVVTDRGSFSNRDVAPTKTEQAGDYVRFIFSNPGQYEVALEYTLGPSHQYLKRRLILNKLAGALTLLKIELGRTTFVTAPRESINYDTFWNAPTVAFLRFDKGGVFTGIENPFFTAELADKVVALAYEPSLLLKPGETYESEPQFIGVYKRTGHMLTDHVPVTCHQPRPRFRNPCGYIPLDRAEIRCMQQFAWDYLGLNADRFRFILYNFFFPLPQMPKAGSPEEAVHLKMIDTFHELGGDMIILNPMDPYRLPAGTMDAYWDLGPAGSAAANVMNHAAGKGIKFGYYMGCARHGDQGNAAALPFAPEKADWKKMDAAGKVAGENCMACDGYADWFFAVQRNTITRFKLDLWSWDPGPGNGLFCHSDQHGHLPGKGAYKGWRNATEMMRRLKETFPGIYFQAFYGRKEHGLWGFKYFDQYESYWEWGPYTNATMHADVHADRLNANGTRFQSWWNQNFRFHPSLLNHCMVHRFQEGVWDPRLVKAWDQLGWKYSVMSCLAAGGDMTTVILPESNDLVPGLREFYSKWIPWARRTAEYRQYNIPFGEQVRPGGVDGWGRIKKDHGFIFLCNPGPRPARIEFGFDDEIGLGAKGRFALKELYPVDGRFHFDRKNGRGVFATGDRVSFVVPAFEVILLELSPIVDQQLPVSQAAIRSDGKRLARFLDDWRLEDGKTLAFPRHTAFDKVSLKTIFRADTEIRELLAAARPKNLADYEPLLPEWRKNYADSFVGARPDRLWLVLPFTEAATVGALTLTVNGKPIAVECYAVHRPSIHYADLTDVVQWGVDNVLELEIERLTANQFLGPYLDYPPSCVTPVSPELDSPAVVYDGPVDPEMPARTPAVAGSKQKVPVITSVTMVPEFLLGGQETKFAATVDMAPDELAGVYISAPWQDIAMQYDITSGLWIFNFTPHVRWWMIMDVPFYRVWAVGKNGMVGDGKDIRLEWRF